jgi:hypothetical protein
MATITPNAPNEPQATTIDYEAPINPGAGAGAGEPLPPPPPTGPTGWERALEGFNGEAPYTPPGSISEEDRVREQRDFEEQKLNAQREALIDIEALTSEYDRAIDSLRGQYQTAETQEEKERLRFILADIEAQYEAGSEAISSLYAETVQGLSQKATDYRAGIEGRAADIESSFLGLAQQGVDRNLARREGLVQDYRGLGVGAGYDPRDANTDFLASLAPIQGAYSRTISESTAGGIDFIAGMAEQQGLAQQGDLKRLAAITRTAAIQTHQQQVAARAQAERAAARSDRNNLQMAALAARQSAMDLNARLMNQALQAQEFVPGVNVQERYTNMTTLATNLGNNLTNPNLFARAFNNQFGGSPPPEFREMYMAAYTSAALAEIAKLSQGIEKTPDATAKEALRRQMNGLLDNLREFGIDYSGE